MLDVHIDFETRSYADLKSIGAWAYSCNPSTDVWCMCYRVDGDPGEVQVWRPGDPVPGLFKQPVRCLAHNYAFEESIFVNVMNARYNFPLPVDYGCTMVLAMRYNLPPALADLAARLGLAEKDMEGHRLMQRMASRQQYDETNEKSNAYRRHFLDITRLIDYCKNDVVVESQAWEWFKAHYRSVDPAEFHLDRKINLRGIQIDTRAAAAISASIKDTQAEEIDKCMEITCGCVESPTQVGRLTEWLGTQGYVPKTLAADVIDSTLAIGADSGVTDRGIRALKLRRMTSLGSIAKFAVMAGAQPDGRMRHLFQLYGGSQTGRWGGRRVQPHNLPRMSLSDKDVETAIEMFLRGDMTSIRMVFGDPFKLAKQLIRPMFIGDAGTGLIVSDLSQIECRVVAWLAGCKPMLDILEDPDRDPYKEMASMIYSRPVASINKDQRQLGKCAILGLGFQMGAPRFQQTVADWTGIKIDDDESQRIVRLFRDTFYDVPQLWYRIDDATKWATACTPNDDRRFQVGYLHICKDHYLGEVVMQLPSGRTLHYPQMGLSTDAEGRASLRFVDAKNQRSYTYGGRMVENATQGCARDVLMDGMLCLDAAGYELVGHVHDEILIQNSPETEVSHVNEIMSTTPHWAAGLPLKAETHFATRYTK